MSAIARAAEAIVRADRVVIAAGAGIGVDSGLPDFRGDVGFWKAYPALAKEGLSFSQVASPATFRSNPRLAWGFYGHRMQLYRATVPHRGFAVLRRLAQSTGLPALVFTSNVDGQFQRAGFDERLVEECHGAIEWLQCIEACSTEIWSASTLDPKVDESRCLWQGALPRCPRCAAILRPNILMFGDAEWLGFRYAQRHQRLSKELRGSLRPAVIEIGAGEAIPSVRLFAKRVSEQSGGCLIRINPVASAVDRALDKSIPQGALEALRALEEAIYGSAGIYNSEG